MKEICAYKYACPFAIKDKTENPVPLTWDQLQTMFGKYVVVTFPNEEAIKPKIKNVYELSITETGKFVHFNNDVEDYVAVEHTNPKLWKLAKIYPLDIDLERYD